MKLVRVVVSRRVLVLAALAQGIVVPVPDVMQRPSECSCVDGQSHHLFGVDWMGGYHG